jgi:hypothetical protein
VLKSATAAPGSAAAATAIALSPTASRSGTASTTTSRVADARAARDQRLRIHHRQSVLSGAYRARELLVLGLQPFDRGGQFLGRHRQMLHRRGQGIAPRIESTADAAPAQEGDARTAAKALGAADGDDADAAGAGHVGAAARGQVERLDLDEAERPPARRLLAQRQSVAASSAVTNRTDTGRSSQTTRLASSTASAISRAVASRARSMEHDSAPR